MIAKRYFVGVLVFSVALIVSLLWPDIVDNKNAYDDYIREYYEPFLYTPLNATKHMPVNFATSSYGKKKFIKDYLGRVPPPVEHVFDTRTKAVSDLYEALHLIRVPGPHATMEINRVESEIERDRLTERIKSARVRKQLGESSDKRDIKGNYHKTNGSAANKENIKIDNERNLFETNSVQLVKHILPTSAPATPKGGQTNINYDDLYSIFHKYSKKPFKSEELHLFNLPHVRASHHPSHGWQKFFIAVNLYNNEDVLPFLTAALVAFIEDELAPFFDVATSVVVSIYANPSTDLTAPLIREFLVPYLQHAGVRTIFVTTKGACGGYLSRQWFHERIEWMTCVRNKAMEPMYEYGMRVFDIIDGQIDLKRNNTNSQKHELEEEEEQHKSDKVHEGYNEDGADNMVVLFFNDIYFRPKDITTLLESVPVQVAPPESFQFDGLISKTVEQEWLQKNKHQKYNKTNFGGSDNNDKNMERKVKAEGTTFDLACGMDYFYTFYDTWVSRDNHGFPFLPWPPYTDDTLVQNMFAESLISDASRVSDANAASQAARNAIPVKCCWNGVAAIRGNLFLQPAPEHRVYMSTNSNINSTTSTNSIYTVNTLGVTLINEKITINETAKSVQTQNVIQRSSGAVYDRVNRTIIMRELSYTYSQILAQRMIEDWGLWRGVHDYLSKIHGRPVLAFDKTWPASVEDAMMNLFTQEPWHSLLSSASSFEHVWLPNEKFRAELSSAVRSTQVTAYRKVHSDTSRLVAEEDDSIYFRARYPALRFRHSYIPSYGASIRSNKEVNAHTHAVPHNVCSSSECLLFCQDVMHAVITQRARLPVILMNPNVRVAYEHLHFERITHKWMYTSPMHYRFFVLLRKLKTFLDIFKLSNYFASIKKWNMFTNNANVIYTENSLVSSTNNNDAYHKYDAGNVDITADEYNKAVSGFAHKEYEFHEKVGSILYKPINASNDWLLTRSKFDSVLQLDVSEYTQQSSSSSSSLSSLQKSTHTHNTRLDASHDKQKEMRFFYIPSLTFMSCFRPGDGKAAMLEPLHVLLRPCYLAISALLLFILFRQKISPFESARSSQKFAKHLEKSETPASLSTAFYCTNNNINNSNTDKSSNIDEQDGNVINNNLLATVRRRFMRNVDDERYKRSECEVERAWLPIV